MGLFSKKKKEDISLTLPKLPELEFPSYEPQVETRLPPKIESKPSNLTFPEREKPSLPELKQIIKDESHREIHEEHGIPIRRRVIPEKPTEKFMPRKMELEDKQPLFVKIENYKEALNDLENIKLRIREADLILDEMNRIRLEEEKELTSWKNELEKIKFKLLEIDRKLFESQ